MIQFCRYVPLVAERAAGVILEIPEPLHGLMSTLSGTAQIVSKGDPLPHFDTHCPLLSLPLAFGTRLETIPSCDALSARITTGRGELEHTAGPAKSCQDRPRLVWPPDT